MTTTATSRPSPRSSWDTTRVHTATSKTQRTSTTPAGRPIRTPASVGQAVPPTPAVPIVPRSPPQQHHERSPSPNYFGFVVEQPHDPADSHYAGHSKSNWSPPSSVVRSTAAPSPKVIPADANPEYEAFRRRSESNSFTLGHGGISNFSPLAGRAPERERPSLGRAATHREGPEPSAQHSQWATQTTTQNAEDPMDVDPPSEPAISDRHPDRMAGENTAQAPFFADRPRRDSPAQLELSGLSSTVKKQEESRGHGRHSQLSLPAFGKDSGNKPAFDAARGNTLPPVLRTDAPQMIMPQDLRDLLTDKSQRVLVLDLRVAPQYAQSRIIGAINLCISTMLLKRPSFDIKKIADTFTNEPDKEKFLEWKHCDHIVLYDANSSQMRDATSARNTFKKIAAAGWTRPAHILRGGFAEFSRKYPGLVTKSSQARSQIQPQRDLSLDLSMSGVAQVAGGCPLPTTKSAANPFFSNIRQNMDLIGGVGQVPLKRPPSLTKEAEAALPKWIRKAADAADHGKSVSDRFLHIEKAEQRRMQDALSFSVSYGTPATEGPKRVQIAGIEKGSKNRYNKIFPYDHSRVKLEGVATGECDYINANYVKAAWSNKRYIATQGPMPATFNDFWRVVWEQDVRVIVMLTAETEGGQLKCHPYWTGRDYGHLRLTPLSERRVALNPGRGRRPSIGQRRATDVSNSSDSSSGADQPYIIVRKFTLSHLGEPFTPMREITQLHYSSWPDFGAPAHPSHLLGLAEQCNAVAKSTRAAKSSSTLDDPESPLSLPVLVHCSAGCGRTGTFCTVDSVIDMLKRQRRGRQRGVTSPPAGRPHKDDGVVRDSDDWVCQDDQDLVAKTVEDFRLQRLSMVQSLRQFVLCYETVLEWLVAEQQHEHAGTDGGSRADADD